MQITLTVTKPSARVAAEAKAIVDNYVAEMRAAKKKGCGNTNWARLTAIVAVCLTVIETQKSVEVTDLFADAIGGKTAPYVMLQRCLNTATTKPYWEYVKPYSLANVTESKGKVTGESATSKKAGVRLFYGPPS